MAPWSLGKWGLALNCVSVLWIVVLSFFMVIPPNELVLWTALAICLFMLAYWHLHVKRRFTGPSAANEQALRQTEAKSSSSASQP